MGRKRKKGLAVVVKPGLSVRVNGGRVWNDDKRPVKLRVRADGEAVRREKST